MKNKVLFVLHLPPPVHGAAVMGANIKSSSIINESFDCTFINLSTSTQLQEIGQGGAGKILALLKIQFKVLYALMSKEFDLCYITLTATSPGIYKDLLIVCLLKLFRKKILYHFHNKGIKKAEYGFWHDLICRYAFKNAKLILLSPQLYSDVQRYVQEEAVYYCPNGISAIELPDRGISRKNNKCNILFLSNLMRAKGVYVLLDAIGILVKKGIAIDCNFVGDWVDISEQEFRQIACTLGVSHCVQVFGKKEGKEKSFYLQNADIFVHPTLNDCFPLVLLEAMQFGLPIVASREGGIEEMVSDMRTGILVEKNNHQQLAEQLEFLIKSPAIRDSFGKAGRKRFNEAYTLESFENRFVKILGSAF